MEKTYREKIRWLLKYCSEYDGHEYMYDEHVREDRFDISLHIEKDILECMKTARIVVLTGDAGDGKSRVLNRIQTELKEAGEETRWEYTNDFSALSREEKNGILTKIEAVLEKDASHRLMIAANSGIFMSEIMNFRRGLFKKLENSREAVIVDFSRRNLASEQGDFFHIVTSYFDIGGCRVCDGCSVGQDQCPFTDNLKKITENGEEGDRRRRQLRTVYDGLFLKGIHVTFRDLLSTLSYMITRGLTCEQLEQMGPEERKEQLSYYNNLFTYDKNSSRLLMELRSLDPARRDHRADRKIFYEAIGNQIEKEQQRGKFKSLIREMYFDSPDRLLEGGETEGCSLLNMEYIREYLTVIRRLKEEGFLDAADEYHHILWKFELGINRIFSPERSDAQLVLFDSPLIISPRVRIEHEAGDELQIYFCTREFYGERKERIPVSDLSSFLCVSVVDRGDGGEAFEEKMAVDYELFRQIMMASESRYDANILNKADDMRLKQFISRTFQHLSSGKRIRVKWLGDAQSRYLPFELYPVRQIGIRNRNDRAGAGKTYRVGRG